MLPADRRRYARSFDTIADRNSEVLRDILEHGNWPVITTFYQSCVNVDELEQLGLEPLREFSVGHLLCLTRCET